MTTLGFQFSRCVGQSLTQDRGGVKIAELHPQCNECRRREPGHPERQAYVVPILDVLTGQCDNRIGPKL